MKKHFMIHLEEEKIETLKKEKEITGVPVAVIIRRILTPEIEKIKTNQK